MSAVLPRLKSLFPCLGLGAALTGAVLLLFVMQPSFLLRLDLLLYDLYLPRLAVSSSPSPIVIVDIDEPSLRKHGQWPWPRYRLALLVERLVQAGASVVGLDIVLSEPDRTSPDRLLRSLREDFGLRADLQGVPEALFDNDVLLARSVAGLPVVFGGYVRFDGVASTRLPSPVSVVERRRPGALPALDGVGAGTGMLAPVPELASVPVGFFNMGPDPDGTVRRVPLLLRVGDAPYAGLGLRMLMTAIGAKTLRLTSGPDGLERIGAGRIAFPVGPDAVMPVPFRGPAHSFPYLRAGDVLDGRFNPEEVRGRMVFVGASATGLEDLRHTPTDRAMPGVEVHATVVDALLQGRSLVVPPWNTGLQAVLIVLLGCAGSFLFGRARPLSALAGGCLLLAGLFWGAGKLFSGGVFVTPLWGMLTVAVEGVGLTGLRFWRAERDKKRLRGVFSRYVSPEVVSRIVDRGNAVLRGEERELTVMFTDLRGFTALSERLYPDQVVSLLNRYFTPMTMLVRNSGGTLDKFIGDALMAFWNAPLDVPEHPRRAVETFFAMKERLARLNRELERDFGFSLRMGAGLHTGAAYVGNMGSSVLTSYTALGDTVNLASRLESLCPRFGVDLVMSRETALRCGSGFVTIRLASVRVKGRQRAETVFTALRPEEALARKRELDQYAEALALHDAALVRGDAGELERAEEAFLALADACPFMLLYGEYAAFCAGLRKTDPRDWNGDWELTYK